MERKDGVKCLHRDNKGRKLLLVRLTKIIQSTGNTTLQVRGIINAGKLQIDTFRDILLVLITLVKNVELQRNPQSNYSERCIDVSDKRRGRRRKLNQGP